MEQIRLFIVDEHENVRLGLAHRLSREPGFEVVGQTSICDQMLGLVADANPNMIIIDPISRLGSCMGVIQLIKDTYPAIIVVVLTAIVDASLQLDLRKLGVQKILTKGIETDSLLVELRLLGSSFPHL